MIDSARREWYCERISDAASSSEVYCVSRWDWAVAAGMVWAGRRHSRERIPSDFFLKNECRMVDVSRILQSGVHRSLILGSGRSSHHWRRQAPNAHPNMQSQVKNPLPSIRELSSFPQYLQLLQFAPLLVLFVFSLLSGPGAEESPYRCVCARYFLKFLS